MKRSAFPHIFASFLCLCSLSSAADPAWWTSRSVINASPASNRSPANIGQAKHMVSQALAELEPVLAPTVFSALEADLAGVVNLAAPVTPAEFENQRKALLVGQLKALSAPFYRKLNNSYRSWLFTQLTVNGTRDAADAGNFYPWTTVVSDDSNMAVATVGQLKAVFALRFEDLPSTPTYQDDDGMDAAWEIANGFDPTNPFDGAEDADGDGISNLDEYEAGTDPHDAASGATSGLSVSGAPVVTLLSPPGAVVVP